MTQEITRDVIQVRMDQKIQENNGKAIGAIQALLQQKEDTTDTLVSSKKNLALAFDTKATLNVADIEAGTGSSYTMHPNAINQLAARFDIPIKYFRELLTSTVEWRGMLGCTIGNEHLDNMDNKTLLLRSVNGQVRAVLSNAYRRMDSAPIFSSFGNAAIRKNAILWDGVCGELNSYLEVVVPRIHEIETPNNGTVYMAFGGSISSSDFGQGSLDVRSFSVQGICANGMIGKSMTKHVHLGKRLDSTDHAYSERTYQADTRTMILAAQDLAYNILDEQSIQDQIHSIMMASAHVITKPEQAMKELPKLGLLEEEIDQINQLLLNANPNDGIQGLFTKWKLQQAVTAVARVLEPVRSREVQIIAGSMN